MSIMVISCKRVSISARDHAHVPTKWVWYLGGAKIELCRSVGQLCAASVARSAFDFIAVVFPQFGLPISEHVAKIHRRFAVHFCSCCHALNKLDSSASRLSSVLATLGTLRPQALRPSKSRAFHGLRM